MTQPEVFEQSSFYPSRSEADLVAAVRHAEPQDMVPIPEIMQGIDAVDLLYYGPHPAGHSGHFLHGYDKEQEVVVRSVRADVLPRDVAKLLEDKVLQYGVAEPTIYDYQEQPDGQAYVARGLGYTFVAFPAREGGLEDRPGASCTFVAKGEDYSYEEVMAQARLRFPSVFERLEDEDHGEKVVTTPAAAPEMTLNASSLYDTRTFDKPTSAREPAVRSGLALLMEDTARNFAIASADQPGADPEDIADRVIAASDIRFKLALRENELTADSYETLRTAAREFMLIQSINDRLDWLERRGLDFRTRSEVSSQDFYSIVAGPMPVAREVRRGSAQAASFGLAKKLGQLASSIRAALTPHAPHSQRVKKGLQGAYNTAGALSIQMIDTLGSHLPDLQDMRDCFFDGDGKLNRRGRVAVAAGVAAVTSVAVVAAYFGLRDVLPNGSYHVAESLPAPGPPRPPAALPELPGSSTLPSGNLPAVPRPPLAEIVPEFKQVKLASGETVWQYAIDALPAGASEDDIYLKTVEIMKASGIPTDAPGPDPLVAARYLPENKSLLIPA